MEFKLAVAIEILLAGTPVYFALLGAPWIYRVGVKNVLASQAQESVRSTVLVNHL